MEPEGAGVEIEVKIRAGGAAEARARLERIGASPSAPAAFEDNVLYDRPDRSLSGADEMLRLRVSAGRATLTWKKRVESDLNAKVRAEVQTSVGSPEAMREILSRLGLVPVYRYQKRRSDYRWADPGAGLVLAISLDETPIGVFLELEGDAAAIDQAARRMGYSEGDYIVEDYRSLHLAWLAGRGLPESDMILETAPAPPPGAERG